MDGADGYAKRKLCDVGVLFAERLYIYRCGFGFGVCALGFVADTIAYDLRAGEYKSRILCSAGSFPFSSSTH